MVASTLSARPCAFRTCNRQHRILSPSSDRLPVKARVAKVSDEVDVIAAVDDEPAFDDAYEIATLSMEQVHELIKTVSEETNIAEVHLKLADLEVKFRRGSGNLPVAAPPPPPPVAYAPPPPPAYAPPPPPLESIDDYDMSESCVTVHSPKVGAMCVHKYVKGNKVGRDPIVKVGDKVKKGQTIAFIAQLGTHWPVEASMAGEVTAILVEDGAKVEYDQPLLEVAPRMASSGSYIAPMSGEVLEIVVNDGQVVEYDQEIMRMVPFFGGHIIGDSKLK